MNPKQITAKFNINQQRFRDNYFLETEIQKYFRVFSLQINSIKDYFYEFINTYRFYAIGSTISLGTRNFPDIFAADDGAVEQSLLRLAQSFNINTPNKHEILFEWNVKFLEKITKAGIAKFLTKYIKYEILKISDNEVFSTLVSESMLVNVYEWSDFEVSEMSSNVYTPNENRLDVYIELILPKKLAQYNNTFLSKIKNIFERLNKIVAVGVKIKFIEFIWR